MIKDMDSHLKNNSAISEQDTEKTEINHIIVKLFKTIVKKNY